MSSSNLQSVQKTTTAQAVSGRTRLVGVYFTNSGTAATLTFKSGGSGGVTKLVLATPAAAGSSDILLPDMGILFEDGVHVTFSSAEAKSVTLFFEGGAITPDPPPP